MLKNSSSENYKIIFGYKLEIFCSFYDYENSSIEPYFEIVQPLFERRAGILLSHKRESSDVELEYVSYGDTGYFVGSVQPVYPENISVPPIKQLWTAGAALDDIRFDLICWVISEEQEAKNIKEIDRKYLPDALTLRYLVKVFFFLNNFHTIC